MENSILEHTCINIIYNDRLSDDYVRLLDEFKVQSIIHWNFWEAITDRKTVVESINASHKRIVKWAKEKGLKEVCIMEQDCKFTSNDSWKYFLENKPDTYDIYSAATYVDDLVDKNILCGFHLYFVHSCFYDTFLNVSDTGHIDTEVDKLKGNFKVCRPFIALQRAGFSFNHQQKVDYNIVLKKDDILK